MKPAPMPWILCGPGLPPERTGESVGSTATARKPGLRSRSTSATPVMEPPVPTPRDQDVDLRRRCRPRSPRRWCAGGPPGWPGSGTAGARRRPASLRRSPRPCAMAPRMPSAPGREHQLGAVGAQQRPPLDAHRLGHREDAAVALRRADEREGDAGVAGGGLHDDALARHQAALGLGGLDHRQADAVLDGPGRVERLELAEDLGAGARRRPARAAPAASDRSAR